MYKEILELKKYCNKIGVNCSYERLLDGFAIRFKNGGDVVQHFGSYGSESGCVEFGYTGFKRTDFHATPLKKAKEFVKRNKYKLNRSVLCTK